MKKLFFTMFFALIAMTTIGQPRMPLIDFSNYEKVDSFILEKVEVNLPFEIKKEDLPTGTIEQGGGGYMFTLPHMDKMIIKTNTDRTKAIIIKNSIAVGGRFNFIFRPYEYNIEENERRCILWYKDNRTYCGYIYDKEYKICQYFESKKEFRRFTRNR